MPPPLEIEVKLSVPSASRARRLLNLAGYTILQKRTFESNTLYDYAEARIRSAGEMLRLRRYGTRLLVTFKGPAQPGRHKIRPEWEIEVSDGDVCAEIFGRLGLQPGFRYEKFRTIYGKPREKGHVSLDETPIGDFLELEGPEHWIDRTAERLGFAPEAYITASYGRLYLEYCKERGVPCADMRFGSISEAAKPLLG